MKEQNIDRILEKHKKGIATPEEVNILNSYYLYIAKNSKSTIDDRTIQESLQEIELRLFPKEIKRFPIYRYAAVIAIFIVIGMIVYNYRNIEKSEANKTTVTEPLAQFTPGHSQAIITLPDGQEVNIDHQDKIINKNGEILLGATNINSKQLIANQFVSVKTPFGGQFQIELEDGSKVWLNSGSKITYPAKFSDQNRTVSLEGEAYFEVARNPTKPFIVKASKDEIHVLGTGFNVQSYKDDINPVTTLVHGKVKVLRTNNGKNESLILKPGERTVSDAALQKTYADINTIIGWKDGVFRFKRSPLENIVKQLERWYDIEFILDSRSSESKLITGEIPRDVKLSDVMEILSYFNIKAELKDHKVHLSVTK